LKVKCKTRISEGNKTYMPGEIISGLSIERAMSLEKSGAATRLDELDLIDLKAINPSKLTITQLKELVKAQSCARIEGMKKDELLAALEDMDRDPDKASRDQK